MVQILDVVKSKNWFYIITEYCNGGTLEELIHVNRGGALLSPQEAHYLTKQICSAFVALQSLQIVHIDFKPQNLMLDFPQWPDRRQPRKIFKSQLTSMHFL